MDPYEEISFLHHQVELVGACVPQAATALAELFAPRLQPRPEVLVARRLLATAAGFHHACENRACRRNQSCRALDVCAPECAARWSGELVERFFLIAAGIELAAFAENERRSASHAYVCGLLAESGLQPAPEPKKGKGRPGRKSVSRKSGR
jgi:hypothetical protein